MTLRWSILPCDDLTVHEARDDAGETVAAVVRDEDGRYHAHVHGQQVSFEDGRSDLDGAKAMVRRSLRRLA